jgi:hypothetical protein
VIVALAQPQHQPPDTVPDTVYSRRPHHDLDAADGLDFSVICRCFPPEWLAHFNLFLNATTTFYTAKMVTEFTSRTSGQDLVDQTRLSKSMKVMAK